MGLITLDRIFLLIFTTRIVRRIDLKAARKRRKLTQEVLAAKIGRRQGFISKLEQGLIAEPSFADVVALADVLGVDPMALRFGHREMPA